MPSFAGGLTHQEIRSAILLGILGFVVLPLLPNRFVDPWRLIQPREAWIVVVVIASLGFLNYVLLRVYGSRGEVSLATNAQLINNINALFLAHEDRFVATPNYYVFEMYSSHGSGQNLRAEFSSPSVEYTRDGEPARFWGLNGSSSQKKNVVTLTVVNPSLDSLLQTQIVLRGRKVRDASGSILTASDMHAHNTFERPDAVKTTRLNSSPSDGSVFVNLPHASVSKIEMTIA